MSLLTTIRDWFGLQRMPPIEHPTLGILRYEESRWKARPPAVPVPVIISANYRGPSAALLAAAATAAEDIASLDTGARAYLVAAAPEPWPPLRLSALEVMIADREWVQRRVAPGNPEEARALLGGTPTIAVQYAIEGDHNILEAIFAAGKAVAWDYR